MELSEALHQPYVGSHCLLDLLHQPSWLVWLFLGKFQIFAGGQLFLCTGPSGTAWALLAQRHSSLGLRCLH